MKPIEPLLCHSDSIFSVREKYYTSVMKNGRERTHQSFDLNGVHYSITPADQQPLAGNNNQHNSLVSFQVTSENTNNSEAIKNIAFLDYVVNSPETQLQSQIIDQFHLLLQNESLTDDIRLEIEGTVQGISQVTVSIIVDVDSYIGELVEVYLTDISLRGIISVHKTFWIPEATFRIFNSPEPCVISASACSLRSTPKAPMTLELVFLEEQCIKNAGKFNQSWESNKDLRNFIIKRFMQEINGGTTQYEAYERNSVYFSNIKNLSGFNAEHDVNYLFSSDDSELSFTDKVYLEYKANKLSVSDMLNYFKESFEVSSNFLLSTNNEINIGGDSLFGQNPTMPVSEAYEIVLRAIRMGQYNKAGNIIEHIKAYKKNKFSLSSMVGNSVITMEVACSTDILVILEEFITTLRDNSPSNKAPSKRTLPSSAAMNVQRPKIKKMEQ